VERATTLGRTPLYDAHLEAGAKLVPFAGWEMPVQYEGIRAEHRAVRSACGVFDVSHMGEIETEGPDAERLLQRLLTNDISKVEVGGAQYSCLCREDGGALDDLFSYRLGDERWLTVSNAANHERDLGWWRRHAEGLEVLVRDSLADWAMLAVQGPTARELVASLAGDELPARFQIANLELAGARALVCGTGYTGEAGVEVLVPPPDARPVWDALLEAGAVPAGLGARDTLRLEVGYCLYGNELTTERNPIEAGLGWICEEATGFIGSEACARTREEGPSQRLVPFVIEGRGIARQGNPVMSGDERAGEVTSGTKSPTLDRAIGMAYVRPDLAEPETRIEIDVRGRRRTARVNEGPLYTGSA
jgi:aminomethyltransferase